MPLTFNLRHLEKKPLELKGELPPEELDAEGMDELVVLRDPIAYHLTVERVADTVLVEGTIDTSLSCECSRCLKPFRKQVHCSPWRLNLSLEGEDRVPVDNDCVDLTPLVREDILLAFPQHPLCEMNCRGLPKAPHELGEHGSGATQLGDLPSAWAELNKLKLQ